MGNNHNYATIPVIIEEEKTSASVSQSLCTHYDRNCLLLCNTCQEFFPCRFCHDACKFDSGLLPAAKRHKFDRYSVASVKCKSCGLVQEVLQIVA